MEQPKIIVAVRKRPLSKKEQQVNQKDIVDVQNRTVVVREPRVKVDLTKYVEEFPFTFDDAFDENTTNEQLFASIVQPLVMAAFNGSKITCFAYGQTGSGKTHTMLGDHNVMGMYTLAGIDIFNNLTPGMIVTVSFYEIYCGKLFDLLNERTQLHPREDGKGVVNIQGLQESKVSNVNQLMKTIELGISSRVTAQNSVNSDSSRSHAILQINLKQQNKIIGKLSFIDLAGSERGADAQDYDKQTRIDGAEINKSLLALKECIRALDLNKNHTPFRGSKLTLVLKDSFIGNCKTVMIGTISPCQKDSEHTLNTLRYADRVKELKGPNNEKFNQLDQLARELMLPRQMPTNNQLFEPHTLSQQPQPQPPRLFDKVPMPRSYDQRMQDQEQVSDQMMLQEKHEELIQQILREEEDIILSHREHIDDLVELVKEEMVLLHNVDKPQSDIEEYVDGLDQLLVQKINKIQKLRQKLQRFKQQLMEEQDLSNQCQTYFYQHQQQY